MNHTVLPNFLPRRVCNEHGNFEIKLGNLTYKYLSRCTLQSGLKKEYYRCINCPARLHLLVDTETVILVKEHEHSVCVKEMGKIMAAVHHESNYFSKRSAAAAVADTNNSRKKKLDIILEESTENLDMSVSGDSSDVTYITFDCTGLDDSNPSIESNNDYSDSTTLLSEHLTPRESDLYDTTLEEKEASTSTSDLTPSCDLTLVDSSSLDFLLSSSSSDESHQPMEMSFVSRYGRRKNK